MLDARRHQDYPAAVVFAEDIAGGDGADSLAAIGYLIAALASPAVSVAVVAYAVNLGVRASR